MKRVMLPVVKVQGTERKTLDMLKSWIETAPMDKSNPQKAIDLPTLRSRSRVLDKLDTVDTDAAYVDVEDGDLDVMKGVIDNVQFVIASPGLVKVVDAVQKAEDVPVVN